MIRANALVGSNTTQPGTMNGTIIGVEKQKQQVGKDLKPASFDDIKPGTKSEIQFQGPVGESFPVQATAGKIVILPGR